MLRMIYLRDEVGGPMVDIYKEMAWSDYDLLGMEDKEMLRPYEDTARSMDFLSVLPEVSSEDLVIGRSISSLLWDDTKGIFVGMVPHDPDFCRITPMPIFGHDPMVDLRASPGWKAFADSDDERVVDVRSTLPPRIMETLSNSGFIPLDPINTAFIRRRCGSYDHVGTSIYSRLVNFIAIQKALLDTTVVSLRRRAAGVLHIIAGDERWEPTQEELSALAGMWMQAEEDQGGGIVATRSGVQADRGASAQGDAWKLSDEWAFLSEGKMRALGVSDAFLSGESTFCVVGSTLILTKDGLKRIDSLADRSNGDHQHLRVQVQSRDGLGWTSQWHYNGEKPTLILHLDNGASIECTYNHKILTASLEYVEAGELLPGDSVRTFDGGYGYAVITQVMDNGIKPVYDLTMEKGFEPAFVANGLVIHNSNMEMALSVFLERLRGFREHLTNQFIYRRIFHTIARAHGFVRPEKNTPHGRRQAALMPTREAMKIDPTRLIVPELRWHKSLHPVGDESYLTILDRMKEAGLPVTLEHYASAGGFNLRRAMTMLDTDVKMREKLKDWVSATGGGGMGMGGSEGGSEGEDSDEGGGGPSIFGKVRYPLSGITKRSELRTAAPRVVGEIPIWDRTNKFCGLSKREAQQAMEKVIPCILRDGGRPPTKQLLLASGLTGRKASAFHYLLTRTGLTPEYAMPEKVQISITEHLATRTNRKTALQEVQALARCAKAQSTSSRKSDSLGSRIRGPELTQREFLTGHIEKEIPK